jgi:hypothetical protein
MSLECLGVGSSKGLDLVAIGNGTELAHRLNASSPPRSL